MAKPLVTTNSSAEARTLAPSSAVRLASSVAVKSASSAAAKHLASRSTVKPGQLLTCSSVERPTQSLAANSPSPTKLLAASSIGMTRLEVEGILRRQRPIRLTASTPKYEWQRIIQSRDFRPFTRAQKPREQQRKQAERMLAAQLVNSKGTCPHSLQAGTCPHSLQAAIQELRGTMRLRAFNSSSVAIKYKQPIAYNARGMVGTPMAFPKRRQASELEGLGST
ncbi:hypothetical protein CDL15_Pgr012689 [Punica granatum]|uniref:Uncharacterized protein n=1 Tax=Punica granatum TaxID=22663 RepID=A0A218XEH3_PUNGR|nr:hypothetical protein CDL15_Pgr012689 [Punica granatum]